MMNFVRPEGWLHIGKRILPTTVCWTVPLPWRMTMRKFVDQSEDDEELEDDEVVLDDDG